MVVWTGPDLNQWLPPRLHRTLYQLVREGNRSLAARAPGYQVWEGRHTRVYYTPADADIAPVIGRQADKFYAPLTELTGVAPPEPALIFIEPDRNALRQSMGWGDGEGALGVYWSGVVRLLSPHVWIDAPDRAQLARMFRRTGPLAHELTHLTLDYAAAGNYPHWFSEGLAQWVERKLTGYVWIESSSTLEQPLYSYEELHRSFDALPNQALAYRQAYLWVAYLETLRGGDGLRQLVRELQAGRPWAVALQRVYSRSEKDLIAGYQRYLESERQRSQQAKVHEGRIPPGR